MELVEEDQRKQLEQRKMNERLEIEGRRNDEIQK